MRLNGCIRREGVVFTKILPSVLLLLGNNNSASTWSYDDEITLKNSPNPSGEIQQPKLVLALPNVRFGLSAAVFRFDFGSLRHNVCFSPERTLLPRRNSNFQGPLSADTVEKLLFEINGDFICDLSVILFSMYEGVVEVR